MEGLNLSGEPLPKVQVQKSLGSVCLQPRENRSLLVPIAIHAGNVPLKYSWIEAVTPLLVSR